MSSLWTPSGEHPVDRASQSGQPGREPHRPDRDATEDAGAEGTRSTPTGPAAGTAADDAEATGAEAVEAEMARVRGELLAVPAATVVANHAMGLYELAAIHLTAPEPKLSEASLAIDALAVVVEGVGDRLGEAAELLAQALDQIRQAYLQVRAQRP